MNHAKEFNNAVPEKPVFFLKPDSALVIKNRPFFYPDFSEDVHHELELVVKISRLGRSIPERFAPRYYSEVALGIDFTARDIQKKMKEKGLPWEIAKAFDYSAPVSEFIPLSELGEISALDFHLDINGKTVQKGKSGDMIFDVNRIISYVSGFITLKTGDLIFTGTPEGVGPVKIGDHLQAWLQDKAMLDFFVK